MGEPSADGNGDRPGAPVLADVRRRGHEAAGELLGALQPGSVTPAYGAEAQRLAEAQATLEQTAGEHAVTRWVARGRERDLRQATKAALDAIATLVAAEATHDNGEPS